MDGLTSWFSYVGDNWDNILEATWQHARLALIVVISATVFAVAVGIAVQQRPTARNAVLSIAGIFLTIPSLALFALFIPIVGIGNPPAIMALFLYSLLPILRNTVTGLDEVNPAVVESARGMGMNKRQQLLKVKLPLAWPVIMAGVRVAAVTTIGLVTVSAIVGGQRFGGLGQFITEGLQTDFDTKIYLGAVGSIILAFVVDGLLVALQRLLTPWTRARAQGR